MSSLSEVAKAITPGGRVGDDSPFSASRTDNWVARAGGLAKYIREVAHALMRKRGMSESRAIQMAWGVMRNWAEGKGHVRPQVRAAAAAAVAEMDAKRGAAHVGKSDTTISDEDFEDIMKSIICKCGELHPDCKCSAKKKAAMNSRERRVANGYVMPGDLHVNTDINENKKKKKPKKKVVAKRKFSSADRKRLKAQGKTDSHGGFPLETAGDVKNAVLAIGRAKNPELEKRRIKAAAKKLGAEHHIPDSWKVSKAHFDPNISDTEFASLVEEVDKEFFDADSNADIFDFSLEGEIEKSDPEKQMVFGWCSIAKDKDGNEVVDKQGDVLEDIDQMEKVAYDFVLHSRDGGEMHIRKGVSTLVESFVSTPEKWAAMGIPEGTLPVGWWVGFKVNDSKVWKAVKDGKYRMFSVHGSGMRKAYEDA